MDERRLEQLLRQGPPFATAYVSRPLPVDEGVAVHHRLTRRRLAVALLTTALLLAATLAALLVFGSLRATHPGPIVIIRSNVISLHPTDGSPEREIVHAVPDRHGDWCPEATVAGWGSCGLFQHLAVTPDGRRLVMSVSRIQLAGDASDSSDLFELNVDGSGLRLVHHEDTAEFDFALAPDGHHVAYTAGAPQANGTRMGILDLDSGEEHTLRDGGSPMIWSPDGEHIAYQLAKEPASAPETWMVDSGGKDPRFLGNYRPLAWTADSRSLFVTTSTGVPARPPELASIDDGSKATQTVQLGATDSVAPSPDGRRVATVRAADRPGQLRIVLSDRDGSDPVVVSPVTGDRATVCWSTDGRWLLWLVGHNQSSETALYAYDTANAATTTLVRVHTTGERAIYTPGCG